MQGEMTERECDRVALADVSSEGGDVTWKSHEVLMAKSPEGSFPSPLLTPRKALSNTWAGKGARVCPTCQGVSGENPKTKVISGLPSILTCGNKHLL